MIRYFFWVFFGAGIATLASMSRQPVVSESRPEVASRSLMSAPETQRLLMDLQGRTTEAKRVKRIELIETLDLLAYSEHYHRSVHGHFTKLMSRLGVIIPRGVSDLYDIRVVEASPDRLLLVAISEENGQMSDWISLDQDYRIHSNFGLPAPRVEYLKTHAFRHLTELKEAQASQRTQESGIYQGYFRFEVKQDGVQGRSIFAVGIRPPVLGMQLDVSQSSELVGQHILTSAPKAAVVDQAETVPVVAAGEFFAGLAQKIQAPSNSFNQQPTTAIATVNRQPSNRAPASITAPEVVGGDLIIEPVTE